MNVQVRLFVPLALMANLLLVQFVSILVQQAPIHMVQDAMLHVPQAPE